jgi:hypothetical protein
VRTVVDAFFPLRADGRRVNPQHAEARDRALAAYDAVVRGGRSRARQMWGPRRVSE